MGRALVGVLGVMAATGIIACEGDFEESEDVGEAESAITMDEPVLFNGTCVSVLAPGDAARVEQSEDLVEMTLSQRIVAGAQKVSTSTLSVNQRRALSALASNPCEVEGEVACTYGTSDNGTRWAMCTDGITTCGYVSTGLLWCN